MQIEQAESDARPVTGATGGIGREIALGLARAGRRVVLVARGASATRQRSPPWD